MGYESGVGVKDGRADIVELENRLGPLPRTFTAHTTSANSETGDRGAQYYFKFLGELRDAPLKKQLAPGVDLKIKDCYIVAPPSVMNGRSYGSNGDINDVAELPPTWIGERIKRNRCATIGRD